MKRTLLIATTNKGKLNETAHFLKSLPFLDIISLDDIDETIDPPEETGETLEENSILKAKYYAEKTGHLVLADDTGMFISTLDGWPGLKSARVAEGEDAQVQTILEKMKGKKERSAEFRVVLTIFDPLTDSLFCAYGTTAGSILDSATEKLPGRFSYDPIFFCADAQKSYGQMDTEEKNQYSHRAKSVMKIKYYLQNTYGSKHIAVPIGLIIQDNKVLLGLRNDPHNPKFHEKWEFPGGTLEFGETMEENIRREVKEEVGYDVEVVTGLKQTFVYERETKKFQFQAILLPFVCRIVGGDGTYDDHEIIRTEWVDITTVPNRENMIGEDGAMFAELLPELQSVIKEHNL